MVRGGDHEGQHDAFGPPRMSEYGFAMLPPGERELQFVDTLERIGLDYLRLAVYFNRPDVRSDPVLARYGARPFLFDPYLLQRIRADLRNIEGDRPPVIAEVMEEYAPRAERLEALGQNIATHAEDGRKGAIGIEIEPMNNARMEVRSAPTRNHETLFAWVDELDAIYQQMRREIRESRGGTHQRIGVYDSVHINVGIRDRAAAHALGKDTHDHRGPYALFTLVGLLTNSIGRVRYFGREKWGDVPATGAFSVNIDSVALGDAARLQNRLCNFSFDQRNRPVFEVVARAMAEVPAGYEKDPGPMRSLLEEKNQNISMYIQDVGRERGSGTVAYASLLTQDAETGLIAVDPIALEDLPANCRTDPDIRRDLLRFAMRELKDLLPKPDTRSATERADDMTAAIDEVLAENTDDTA